MPEWRANIAAVCDVIERLRGLATDRQDILARWAARSGVGVAPIGILAADELIGLNTVSDPGHIMANSPAGVLLDAARRAGIIT